MLDPHLAPSNPGYSSTAKILRGILLGVAMAALNQVAYANDQPPVELPANPPIRVQIMDSTTEVGFQAAEGEWSVRSGSGEVLLNLPSDKETTIAVGRESGELVWFTEGTQPVQLASGGTAIILASSDPDSTVRIRQVPYGVGWWWETKEDRLYEGQLEIRASAKATVAIINELPLESYLRGVVPSEIGVDSPFEALCAQAVAARSAAILALTSDIYRGYGYDICSDVACQAFSGLNKATALSDQAVSATRGLILVYDGRPLSAYYASNSGGHTEDIRAVWPDRAQDQAYWDTGIYDGEGTFSLDLRTEEGFAEWLASSPEVWSNPAHNTMPSWAGRNFRWEREIEAKSWSDSLSEKYPQLGPIIQMRPLQRGVSGRLIRLELIGENGRVEVGPELAIRQLFHPPLRSAAFQVEAVSTGDRGGDRPSVFIVRGAGWGHGVGMCQSGAIAMAHRGRHHRDILKNYYPKATLVQVYLGE
jgi:SpoIID/LytB domain protein